MTESINPTFEYDGKPVIWAAVTAMVLSVGAIFVIERPAWILPIGFIAGSVAAATGEFSGVPANNGLLGVLIALVPIYASIILYRILLVPAAQFDADTLFFSTVLGFVDILVYGPVMLLMGYLGGIVGDHFRRRTNSSLGY